MFHLLYICIAAGFALLIVWGVNALVDWMSGEHPRDTGRQFGDVFFRILGVMRLGLLGRALDNFGWPRRFRWVLYCAGGVLILSAVMRACAGR